MSCLLRVTPHNAPLPLFGVVRLRDRYYSMTNITLCGNPTININSSTKFHSYTHHTTVDGIFRAFLAHSLSFPCPRLPLRHAALSITPQIISPASARPAGQASRRSSPGSSGGTTRTIRRCSAVPRGSHSDAKPLPALERQLVAVKGVLASFVATAFVVSFSFDAVFLVLRSKESAINV